MTIFTADKSVFIDSPRHLTLRQARRNVIVAKKASGGLAATAEDIPDPSLGPGQEQLYSYWAPNLAAGPTYDVRVSQVLNAPDNESLTLKGHQRLTVDAPQFTLPAGSVHSCYPPAGYSEDHRILPHIVLTDPHLPWEREATNSTVQDPPPRNKVPWLALLAFTADELQLLPSVLDGSGSIFSRTSNVLQKPVKQTSSLTVNMTVQDAMKVENTAAPFFAMENQLSDATKAEASDFIFLSSNMFQNLFSPFDDHGVRQIPANPDTTPFQYLSHVRNINTSGMALAGVEDTGVFSIVISARCGTLNNTKPTSTVVHLVSIEGVQNMTLPLSQPRVALCSLQSWTYSVLPPRQLDVFDSFTNIGKTLGVLRPPDDVFQAFENQTPPDPVSTRIAERMRDGYSLIKYRTQTGEPTMALFRGPLTPNVVAPIPQLQKASNSGVDFQILDQELGIMDITYSSAWQLGRSLALANQAVCAALGRLRTAIQTEALKLSRLDAINDRSATEFRTRTMLLGKLGRMTENLSLIQMADPGSVPVPFEPGGPLKRWKRPLLSKADFPGLSFRSPAVRDRYQEHAIEVARKLAKATDGTIFDETNSPVSSDWMIILAWVMDRMFLVDVPAHYSISDPSHLTQERLNFFYIDPNWIDAMIDGALSLANHMGNDKDRTAIKVALNDFIRSKPDLQPHAPQIPTYGFFLRSDVVSRFPDLRVTTLPTTVEKPVRAPLLRHEIIADGVMMGLFDRIPNSGELSALVFTQPPHQQRFAVANNLGVDTIGVTIRRQYTVDLEIREKDPKRHDPLNVPGLPSNRSDSNSVFIWGSSADLTDIRMLRLPRFPTLQRESLSAFMGIYPTEDPNQPGKYFDDDTATSALFAMQLNDPVYRLVINFDSSKTSEALASLQPPDADQPSARTLTSLEASTVQEVDVHADQDGKKEIDSSDEGTTALDHNELMANATNTRPADHQAPAIATMINRGPNVASFPDILSKASELVSKEVKIESGDGREINQPQNIRLSALETSNAPPANPPKFVCEAYQLNEDDLHNVYAGRPTPEDVIFAVHVENTMFSAAKLKEFEIRVQLGIADPNKKLCLMAKYAGSGASMVSNQRFNVLVSPLFLDGIPYLSLRVLPRAAAGSIAVTKMGYLEPEGVDISFILGMVTPNDYKKRAMPVQLKTFVTYASPPSTVEDEFEVTLVNEAFPK